MTVSTSDVWLCVDMITQTKNKKNKIEGGECVRVLSDKKAEVVRHDEQWDKICQYILSYLKKAKAKQFLHILLKHNKLNTNRLLGATFDFSTNHYSTTTLKHSNQSFFQMKSLISNKKRLSEKKNNQASSVKRNLHKTFLYFMPEVIQILYGRQLRHIAECSLRMQVRTDILQH